MTHHPVYDDIKAAVEAAETVAEKIAAAFVALVNSAQTAVDNEDDAELQSILDTAKQTASVLGAAIDPSSPATLPDAPPPPPPTDTGVGADTTAG